MISHGKHLAAIYTLIDRYPVLNRHHHRTFVHLPLCHLAGKVTALSLPLLTRIIPHYGESLDIVEETMNDRLLPGEGCNDVTHLIRMLDAMQVNAPLGVEVFNQRWATMSPRDAAQQVATAMRAVVNEARA